MNERLTQRLESPRVAFRLRQDPPAIHARPSPAGSPDPRLCREFEPRKINPSAGYCFGRSRMSRPPRRGNARGVPDGCCPWKRGPDQQWRSQNRLHLETERVRFTGTYQRGDRNRGVVV